MTWSAALAGSGDDHPQQKTRATREHDRLSFWWFLLVDVAKLVVNPASDKINPKDIS